MARTIASGENDVTVKDWVSIINVLAWPIVAILILVYVWRSDAIAKLIQIADAVDDLKGKLAALVETEQRLSERTTSISEIVSVLQKSSSDFAEIKAEVENIRDRVDEEVVPTIGSAGGSVAAVSAAVAVMTQPAAETRLGKMETAWNDLLRSLSVAFGDVDKRSVAGDVYRFAHGNRKGPKLSYETAAEIARLHSSIKSYRRRKASMAHWLDDETSERFIEGCEAAERDLRRDIGE